MTRQEAERLADDRAAIESTPVFVFEDREGYRVTTATFSNAECVYTAWPWKGERR